MKADIVIVGGGSAGCVLAARLSEDKARRVLLLEAGGWDLSPILAVPAGEERALASGRYTWPYRTEPDPTRNGRAETWPAGRVLGGGSSVNGMIWLRGNRGDYDGWAERGATGWDFAGVLPYFRRAESNSRPADQWRGAHGPQSVSDLRSPHQLAPVFLEAAQACGLPLNQDVNGASQYGAGMLQASQKRGWRHSAAKAYLWPVLGRRNLRVLCRAAASRIDIHGARATGVDFIHHGRPACVDAGHVIVSAGALASPALLMRSGIGPADHLRRHDIAVAADRPGVGRNLQEHPGVLLLADVTVRTLNVETSPARILRHAADFLLRGRGPGTTAIGHAVAFAKTHDGIPQADVQITFTPIGYNSDGGPILLPDPAIVLAVNVCRPDGRGQVRLRSAEPNALPIIDHRMFDSPADLQTLTCGAQLARRMLQTSAFAPFVLGERAPGDAVQTDADWHDFLRARAMRFSHPAGTCRMGQDQLAVVDPTLSVHGVAGLSIADASIMPTLPSANTNAACVMIGEKAADIIRMKG